MKIKLKPLNRGDKKCHHSDDLTDAVALKRMFPELLLFREDAKATSSSETRIVK